MILETGISGIEGQELIHWVRESRGSMPGVMIRASESGDRGLRAREADPQVELLKLLDMETLSQFVNCWFETVPGGTQ